MAHLIAGVRIPETMAAVEATRLAEGMTGPLIHRHSVRVFLFGALHARRLGLDADPELLHLAAVFHDTGLLEPFSATEQRFELDGADHARRFLQSRGFGRAAADTVWTAIALHTTPGVPGRMGPEVAAVHLGVLTDVVGHGRDALDPDDVDAILVAYPRGDFANGFLRACYDGQRHRPRTTDGTVNADVLEHFDPAYRRTTTVARIAASGWPT